MKVTKPENKGGMKMKDSINLIDIFAHIAVMITIVSAVAVS